MFVTYVKDNGPFLKIFGRVEEQKNDFVNVEESIHELMPFLSKQKVPHFEEIGENDICLVFSERKYKRSKIINVSEKGFANVLHLDYGNTEIITIELIRLLTFDHHKARYLIKQPPTMSEFILSEIFGSWNLQILEVIRQEICNKEVGAKLRANVSRIKIIDIIFNSADYGKKLIAHGLGQIVFLDHQIELIRDQIQKGNGPTPIIFNQTDSLKINSTNIIRQIPSQQIRSQIPAFHNNIGMQPTYFPVSQMQQVRSFMPPMFASMAPRAPIQQQQQQLRTITRNPIPIRSPIKVSPNKSSANTAISTFKSSTLRIGTVHEVYCSHIEDGPFLFSVQLANDESELSLLMTALETSKLKNLSEKPSLGMACVARYSVDKRFYRAVIMKITPTSCQVGYVDYGNSETVAYPDIFEIPSEYLKQRVYAMKFTLSGYKELLPLTDALKRKFEDLVLEQKLTLKVAQIEGVAFVQYCELSQGKLNIFHELKNIPKKRLKYVLPPELAKNFTSTVIIRYVDTLQKLFIQLVDNGPDYDDVMDRLHLHCQTAPKLTELSPGTVCAAHYDDFEWYRAEIIEIKGKKATIRYVDFGNTQDIDVDTLRELRSEFTILPCQAIECCLKGFETAQTVSDSSRIQLEMLSENEAGDRKRLKLHVQDKLDNGIPIVNLIDESCEPPLNIAKRVIKLTTSLKPHNPTRQTSEKFAESENIVSSSIIEKDFTANTLTTISHVSSNWENNTTHNGHQSSTRANISISTNNTFPDDSRPSQQQDSIWDTSRQGGPSSKLNDSLESFKSSSSSGKHSGTSPKPKHNRTESRNHHTELMTGVGGAVSSRQRPYRDNAPNIYRPPNDRAARPGSGGSGENFNKRTSPSGGEYRREKYSNIKKLIPRFNKQANANKRMRGSSKEKFARDKNFGEGRQFDNSDTSGKFSSSSVKSDRKSELIVSQEFEEFEPFDTEFIQTNIIFNKREDIFMSWWTSPSEFYVYYRNVQNTLEVLMKDMQKFYKNRSSTILTPNNGSSVIARNPKDNLFYRARIVNSKPDLKKYRVEYVDFGNRSVVTLENIWDVEKRFLKVPRISIQCSLRGIILNDEPANIIEKIDMYLSKESAIQCEFKKTENDVHFVDIYVNGNNLRESFIKDGFVLPLPEDVSLRRLIGQTIQLNYISIVDLSNFSVKIDGVENILLCSYTQMNHAKPNVEKSEQFKNLYETQYSAARVDDITRNNRLLVTPLIPILEETRCPVICDLPILTNTFNAVVIHIEPYNLLFVHKEGIENVVTQLLEDMWSFYEAQGTEMKQPVVNELCAAKAADSNWYRGYIESIDATDSSSPRYKIRFLDYGNSEFVPKESLKFLEKNHCTRSALATKMYMPLALNTPDDADKLLKTVNEMITGYMIEIDVNAYVSECFIGEVKNNGANLIDIINQQNLGRKMSADEIEEFVAKSENSKPRPFIEFNFDHKPEDVDPSIQARPKFSGVPAVVSHVDNPERIYLQLESNLQAIENLQNDIQIIAPSLQQLESFKVETLCIAKYSTDGIWYRARIIDHGDGITTVIYIDFGNADVITVDVDLKIMPEAFAKFEPYAIFCSLPVRPKTGSDWDDATSSRVLDLIEKTVLFEYISQVSQKKYVNIYYDDKDFSKSLLMEGCAKECDVIKSGEKCFISHYVSCSEFYVQLESGTNNLEIMEDYLSNASEFPIILKPKEGAICAALFPEDMCWYRAKFISENESGAQVHFIDYGNQSFTKEIRQLPDDIANLPAMAKKCSLYISKNISHWSEEAESKFVELGRLGETIFEIEMELSGDVISVHLYINGRDIIEDLEPLCPRKVLFDSSMTESVVEAFLSAPSQLKKAVDMPPQAGYVCYINSPSDFYVHFKNDENALNELSEFLEQERNNLNLLNLSDVKEGDICVAEFPEDSQLYRARVLAKTNDGCEVNFVDWGNNSFVSKIYVLPQAFTNLDLLAKHCALHHDQMNNVYNAESSAEFIRLTDANKIFEIDIVKHLSDPIQVVLRFESENINEIIESTLHASKCDNSLSVASESQLTNDKDSSSLHNLEKDLANQVLHSVDDKLTAIDNQISKNLIADVMASVNTGISNVENQMSKCIIQDVLTSVNSTINQITNECSHDIINGVLETVNEEIADHELSTDVVNDVLVSTNNQINAISRRLSNEIVDAVLETTNDRIATVSNEISTEIVNDIISNSENEYDLLYTKSSTSEMNLSASAIYDSKNLLKQRKLGENLWNSLEQLGYDTHRRSTPDLYPSSSTTSSSYLIPSSSTSSLLSLKTKSTDNLSVLKR